MSHEYDVARIDSSAWQGTETAPRLLVNHLRPELLPPGEFPSINRRQIGASAAADGVALRAANQFTEPLRPEQ